MSNHHQTKEFRLMRAVTIWLHNGKCAHCKKVFYNIEVHHIDKNPRNNQLINLKPLCKLDHNIYNKIPVQPYLTRQYIVILLLRKIEFYTVKPKKYESRIDR